MQQMILFDLDDTLIDTHQRHYFIFSDFLKKYNSQKISFEEYISQRRKRTFSNKILMQEMLPEHADEFDDYFARAIESTQYLKFDRPIVNDFLLKAMKEKNIKATVLSLRSNRQTAMDEVKQFSFYNLMDEFIFLKHHENSNPKSAYITQLKVNNEVIAFIGDNAYDKRAAEETQTDFYAVSTGMYPINDPIVYKDVNTALQQILK